MPTANILPKPSPYKPLNMAKPPLHTYPCIVWVRWYITSGKQLTVWSANTKNYYIYFLNFLLQKKYQSNFCFYFSTKCSVSLFHVTFSVSVFPQQSNYNNKVAMQSMRSLKATMIRLITCKLRIRSLEWNTFVILCTAGYNPQKSEMSGNPRVFLRKNEFLTHKFTILLTIFAYSLAYCAM